jgi:hypothetical protein
MEKDEGNLAGKGQWSLLNNLWTLRGIDFHQ